MRGSSMGLVKMHGTVFFGAPFADGTSPGAQKRASLWFIPIG